MRGKVDTNLYLLQTAAQAAQLTQDNQSRNTIILAVIGLLGTLITTFGTVLLARIGVNTKATAESSKQTAETAKATDGKTSVLLQKTDEIHVLTNSNLSKVTAALEVMTTKNVESEKMIVALNQRIADSEKRSLITSLPNKEDVKTAVTEAVVESVKEPVKEAVTETLLTNEQINQIIEGLRSKQSKK